jgi:hypothetical protein
MSLENSVHKNLPAMWYVMAYPNAQYAKFNFTQILKWNSRPKVEAGCIDAYIPPTPPPSPAVVYKPAEPTLQPTINLMSALQPLNTKRYEDSKAPVDDGKEHLAYRTEVAPTPAQHTPAFQRTSEPTDDLESKIVAARTKAREAAMVAMAKAAQTQKSTRAKATRVGSVQKVHKKGGHKFALVVLFACLASVLLLCVSLGRMSYLAIIAVEEPGDGEAAAVVEEVYGTGAAGAGGYATIGQRDEDGRSSPT